MVHLVEWKENKAKYTHKYNNKVFYKWHWVHIHRDLHFLIFRIVLILSALSSLFPQHICLTTTLSHIQIFCNCHSLETFNPAINLLLSIVKQLMQMNANPNSTSAVSRVVFVIHQQQRTKSTPLFATTYETFQ